MKLKLCGILILVGAVGAACKKTPVISTGGTGGTGTTTSATGNTTSKTTTTSTKATVTSNTTATTGGGTCAAPLTTNDCSACADNVSCAGDANSAGCCGAASMAGLNAANTAFIKECACAAGSTCNAQCSGAGDVCPGLMNNPSMACIMCLNNNVMTGNACITAFQNDCKANADCVTYVTCIQACPPAAGG